MGIRRRELC